MNPQVDLYFSKLKNWHSELEILRNIVLECGLTEGLKWGVPCYTFQKNNIVLLGVFKEYCVLSFVKGALLSDVERILLQQTEKSQAVRIIKFTNTKEILGFKPVLKTYIYEAVEVEKVGLKVIFKKISEFDFPEELQNKFDKDAVFKTAFESLTPGRQRGYLLHFSDSKQAKTREARIEKYSQQIFAGKGLNDCTCGLSKRLPTCDGSHKFINMKVT